MKHILAVALLAATTGSLFAQVTDTLNIKDVVVTATKFSDEKENIVRPVYEVTTEQIENHPANSLSELLNTIPNLHISEALGNAGSNQNYYSRGGRSKDVLILINGVPMSDDSQISNFEDLNMIPKEQIKKIEVLNSGASTLYGASASTGLINIILKDASRTNLNAKFQFGKYGTVEQGVQAGFVTENQKFGANISYNRNYTNGFSAATDRNLDDAIVFDNDGSDRHTATATLQLQPTDNFSLRLMGSSGEHDYDFDGGAFFDGNNTQENDKDYAQLVSDYDYNRGTITLKASTAKYNRKSNGFYKTAFDSKNLNADLYNVLKLDNDINVVTGIYYKQTEANSFDNYSGTFKQTISSDVANYTFLDPYAAINTTVQGVMVDVGGRYHTHSNYDSKLVYHGNLGYQFDVLDNAQLKVRGGINTAFNAPSLYQTYSASGNKALTPEEFRTIEGGVDFYFDDRLDVSATYFTRKEDNAIVYGQRSVGTTVVSGYLNTGKENDVKGFEAKANMNWNKYVSTSAFYAKSKSDDSALFYKQPKNEFGFGVTANTNFNTSLAVDFRQVGDRVMTSFSSVPPYVLTEQNVEAYSVLNATVSQRLLQDKINIFMNANNILDEEVVDNLGYNSADFNMNAGIRLQLQ